MRKLVASTTLLLVIAAIATAVLIVWPRLGDWKLTSEPAVVTPTVAQDGGAPDTVAATGADTGVEAAAAPDGDSGMTASVPDDSASAMGSLSSTNLAATMSNDIAAGGAIDDGLPPLPGEKPDPG